jgi:hypothetical protein
MDRARAIATTIAALPAESVRENRRLYNQIAALSGHEAWVTEALASRQWMEQRFDQSRLAEERATIIARGREQSTGADGTRR